MALKPCRQCKTEISASAKKCPKCERAYPTLPGKLCRECKQDVSAGDKTCPNCGAKHPAMSKRQEVVIAGVVVALFALVIIGIDGSEPSSPKRVSIGEKTQIFGSGFYGCAERETFDKLTSLIVQRDEAAFNEALTGHYATGRCVRLRGEVYLTDLTVSGLARVRKDGEAVEYWTNVEAVTRP
jgi:RNA polymerase subunit RPABC4/transcription elongation factor Spt4